MKWRSWAAVLLAAMLILAPALAEARAGGSYRSGGSGSFTSQGSRGSQTYSPNGAAPLERSITPQNRNTQPGYGGGGYGIGGFGYGHPFLSGLAGGFFGSWIGSMLFPHWGMGYGVGGMFGSIFTWLILLGLIWFVFRLFRGGFSRMSTYPSNSGGLMGGGMGGGFGAIGAASGPSSNAPRLQSIGIAGADYQQFEDVLKGVQAAWSRGDLSAMRHYVTPEMLSYFSEELAANESQGVVNKVEDVELLKGEVREAWDEGPMQYSTVLLHWRARDYTARSGGRPGEGEIIADGDPQRPSEATELWTFARSPGGRWLLSAIQQV